MTTILPAATGKRTHQARYTCMEYRFKVFARQHWNTGDIEAAMKWAMDTSRENGTHCQVYDNRLKCCVFRIGPKPSLLQNV